MNLNKISFKICLRKIDRFEFVEHIKLNISFQYLKQEYDL